MNKEVPEEEIEEEETKEEETKEEIEEEETKEEEIKEEETKEEEIKEEEIKEEEIEEEEAKEKEEKKEKKRYVHNCTKCGICCEKWEEIPIYLEDLQKWIKDGTIHHVLPFLQLRETPPAYVRLVIQKHPIEGEDPNPSGCPLYDYSNKICNVYSSMPFHCSAYPLAYNGEKYFLVDTDSPGLGNGTMSKETLELARARARDYFDVLSMSSALLPVLYTMILANIMKKSQEAMDTLSEEDKKKLDDLLSKTDETDEADETDEIVEAKEADSIEEEVEKEE